MGCLVANSGARVGGLRRAGVQKRVGGLQTHARSCTEAAERVGGEVARPTPGVVDFEVGRYAGNWRGFD